MQPTLRRCFDYAKSHQNVWFARKGDIAGWAFKRESAKASAAE